MFYRSNAYHKTNLDVKRKMLETAEGNLNAYIEEYHENEFGILERQYNTMLKEIRELLKKSTEDQQNLKKAELKALQSQINPHFLYNTLDTIMWLVAVNENEKAIEMIESLSVFFKTGLSKGMDWIPVEREIEHVKSYLYIQQSRYSDILQYVIDISPDMIQYDMLKMTLQPIVENAIYHGIKNKENGGSIIIKGNMDGKFLSFLISDTGVGMEAEAVTKLNERMQENKISYEECENGFGLYNVNRRIKLYCGEESGITVESQIEEGTKVHIRMLAIRRKSIRMYNMIIVEDEKSIRENLQKGILWEKYGFHIVAEAANGEEALEKIEKLHPDVLLTDIKMPFMDGLELARIVHSLYSNIKIVIISGYTEFTYAKEAITIGVEEYLVKPVTPMKVVRTFTNLKQKMDEERQKSESYDAMMTDLIAMEEKLEKYHEMPKIKAADLIEEGNREEILNYFLQYGKIEDIQEFTEKYIHSCNQSLLNSLLYCSYFLVQTIVICMKTVELLGGNSSDVFVNITDIDSYVSKVSSSEKAEKEIGLVIEKVIEFREKQLMPLQIWYRKQKES